MPLHPLRRFASALAIVGLVLTSAATVAPATAGWSGGAEVQAKIRAVRVMSFNIHHARGTDDVVDLQRVAAVIEDSGARIVGLQEVDRHLSERSDFVDQATFLARRLDMQLVYGANLDLDPLQPGAPRRQYGTAILSDYPIRAWRNFLLPRTGINEQRGLLKARLNIGGDRVLVYNTHLQHNSQAERLAQIDAIRGIIGTPEPPVVLVGDLNATPNSPEISAMTEGLRDAWVEAGVGNGYTAPAQNPMARIDYVMMSDDVVARSAAVIRSNASDHLPVYADLVLPRNT